MAWYWIVLLAIVGLYGLMSVLGFLIDDSEAERARIEMEVRRAERRLHDIASNTFQAMLNEARAHDDRWAD
jgi:hypothetical protein